MKVILVVSLLVNLAYIFTLVESATVEPSFRKDYKYVPAELAFYKVHPTPVKWEKAHFFCQVEGAHLAVAESKREANVILQLLDADLKDKQIGAFVGVHDKFSEGNFVSILDVPISKLYNEWAQNKANDLNNDKNCVIIQRDGKLNDVSCDDKYPFVCKKSMYLIDNNAECENSDLEYFYEDSQSRCYKLHLQPRNWEDAYATCTAEQSHLAIINSFEEAKVLQDKLAKHPSDKLSGDINKDAVFLGFRDLYGHGVFYTITGQLLKDVGYTEWAEGEPNNAADEGGQCGSMYRNGTLNDLRCGEHALFFCERELSAAKPKP